MSKENQRRPPSKRKSAIKFNESSKIGNNILKGLLYFVMKTYERSRLKYPEFFRDKPDELDPTTWSLEYGYSPKQQNGYDCGIHVLMNMYFLSVDLPLIHHDRDMEAYRKRIAFCVMNNGFY